MMIKEQNMVSWKNNSNSEIPSISNKNKEK